MKSYLIRKNLFIAFISLVSAFLLFTNELEEISLEIVKENRIVFFTILGLWLFTLYHLIAPFVSWYRFKKEVRVQTDFYLPTPIDLNLRKALFNIKVHSNNEVLDLFDNGVLKATFYRNESKIKIKSIGNKNIDQKEVKAIVARFTKCTDYFQLRSEENSKDIYTARFYLLDTSNQLTSFLTMDCKFSLHQAKFVEKSMHSKEDIYEVFSNYSKLIADLTLLPLLIHKR